MIEPMQPNHPGDPAQDVPGLDLARAAAGDSDLRRARAAIPARLLSYGVAGAIAFWIIESAIHTWLIRGWGSYLENVFPPDANELWMRLLVVVMIMGNGAVSAALTRKLIRQERRNDRLHRDLHDALLRNLTGVVSMCMHCKRVRNPSEQWDAIEKYLAARTELRFSHGICATCFAKHYPN
jgi:hypothetical protein